MAIDCEVHRAFIYDRGGANRLFELTPLSRVHWERLRDDMSAARVTLLDPDVGCQERMRRVAPHRHELVIFRGEDRVWEGPITLMGWHNDRIEVEAKDVMYYAYRTAMRDGYDNSYPAVDTVVNRAVAVLGELSRKEVLDPPINVLPHLTAFSTPDDARTARITIPYQSTVFQEVDGMAWRSGLDYTTIGRRILLFDRHVVFSRTPQVTEADFLSPIIATQYGSEHATWSASVSGQGNVGIAYATGTNQGVDPFYGLWEIVDSAYGDDGATEPTEEALEGQAARNLYGRNPVPLHVRIPDNSQLNPQGVLRMEHLVPGIRVPLRATLLSIEVSQMQKLDRVVVEEDGESGERISVTLFPADATDEAPED